jgi:hypothetical protein
MALHVLAYNLTRVMNIMGVQPLMAAMRAWSPPLASSLIAKHARRSRHPNQECFQKGKQSSKLGKMTKRGHLAKIATRQCQRGFTGPRPAANIVLSISPESLRTSSSGIFGWLPNFDGMRDGLPSYFLRALVAPRFRSR